MTGWLRAPEIASRAGLSVSSHTFIEFSAHLLAVTPTAGWLEYLDHAGEILREPLVVRDGFAMPSNSPAPDWNGTNGGFRSRRVVGARRRG